jgi:hypothetical protein
VKHDRPGDWLWDEWDGDGYDPVDGTAIIYATQGSVDITDDLVRRALASALQRDGVASGLGHGFKMLERSTTARGYAGTVQGEHHMTTCDLHGVTSFGDMVDERTVITWVELPGNA